MQTVIFMYLFAVDLWSISQDCIELDTAVSKQCMLEHLAFVVLSVMQFLDVASPLVMVQQITSAAVE